MVGYGNPVTAGGKGHLWATGICGRAHPCTLSLAGTWPRGDAEQGDRIGGTLQAGAKDRERGQGLLTAQSSGGHSAELTFGGNPQQVLLQPDVTCVEFRAVDCSHHWVQLPACGQGELVRTGHCLHGALRGNSRRRRARGAALLHWAGAAALPFACRCGRHSLPELHGRQTVPVPGGAPACCSPCSLDAGPYRWCRGWPPSCWS